MKKLSMFFAVAAAAIMLTGCPKPADDDPIIIVPGEDEVVTIPELDAPAADMATIVIQIPEGTQCNGIRLKGTLGDDWTGADEYVGLEGVHNSAADAVEFKLIEGTKDWYAATFKLGKKDDAPFIAGKICLVYAGDSSWQGQAVDWEYIDDNCTATVDISDGNLQIHSTGLVYIKIGGWQNSECVESNKAGVAHFEMTAEVALPEGAIVGIVGGDLIIGGEVFSWNISNPVVMAFADGKYTADAEVSATFMYKYAYKLTDTEWNWSDTQAGENFKMPLDLKPVDVVTEWVGVVAPAAN